MDSEDGELFVKQLASFVRTHEKALANALQFKRQNLPRHGSSQSVSSVSTTLSVSPPTPTLPERPSTSSSTNSLAAALSFGSLSLTSNTVKSAKLALTPHHLFYLLSRFEELGIPVGPMKVRLENLHDSSTSVNYVSFLSSQSHRSQSRGSDVVSIRSVSSIRSVMSGMSSLWASFGLGSSISAARTERQKAVLQADLKYLYSSFTKIPCLRLAPDWRARLIRGYEEFPFDSAVPLYVFKNVQALEVSDIDFRQFFGWDRLADQLRSLTVKRAGLDDPADILIDIVLDDMDKRRRRTSKSQASPTTPLAGSSSPRRSSAIPQPGSHKSASVPGSPGARHSGGDLPVGSLSSDTALDPEETTVGRRPSLVRNDSDEHKPSGTATNNRPRSNSPARPASSRHGSTHQQPRGSCHKIKRSGSGSSHSSLSDSWHNPRNSGSNLLAMGILPASKWRFLKHLSLADNSLTSIPGTSLAPLVNTLHSLDLSSNLFTQIPDSLANLTALRALNLSHCMIDSLQSLTRNPLPAIAALNLRGNRLQSLAGIERLYPLERLDLRDNRLTDPQELLRLTGIPEIREIWVEGNPFTRTHRDYRITIFNHFRRTPGYTEEVMIDATGPSYSEKRYLIERAPVPEAVPVVKPTVPELPAVDVRPVVVYNNSNNNNNEPSKETPNVLRKERPAPKAAMSEVNTSGTRRRKANKRRIVDLATNNDLLPLPPPPPPTTSSPPRATTATTSGDTQTSIITSPDGNYRISVPPETPTRVSSAAAAAARPAADADARASSEVPRINTSVIPQLSPILGPPEMQTGRDTDDSGEWDVGGEMYRRKIEALRDKVGNGYLSVLGEEGWVDPSARAGAPYHHHHHHHHHYHRDTGFGRPTSPLRTNPAASTPVQAIASGRTLG